MTSNTRKTATALSILPYLLLLSGSIGLFRFTDTFINNAGQPVGPDTWPKIILGLLVSLSGYEVIRQLASGVGFLKAQPTEKNVEVPDGDDQHEIAHVTPVLIAIIATIAYLLLLDEAGFAISTFFLVIIIMWVGQFRRWAIILPLSLAIDLFLLFVFMKLVFVPLPLGKDVFEAFSTRLLSFLGIH